MKRFIFQNWKDWRDFCEKSFVTLAKGLARVVITIVFGIISLLIAAYKVVAKFVRNNAVLSLSVLCFVVIIGWLASYIGMQAEIKTAEYKRDSLSYQMQRVQDALEGDTIIVSGIRKKTVIKNQSEDAGD